MLCEADLAPAAVQTQCAAGVTRIHASEPNPATTADTLGEEKQLLYLRPPSLSLRLGVRLGLRLGLPGQTRNRRPGAVTGNRSDIFKFFFLCGHGHGGL